MHLPSLAQRLTSLTGTSRGYAQYDPQILRKNRNFNRSCQSSAGCVGWPGKQQRSLGGTGNCATVTKTVTQPTATEGIKRTRRRIGILKTLAQVRHST